jgi:ABC-2 type transport system permease protein
LKVLATIKKEFLLLTRDLGGLTLIFFMPLALVVVMALIQDNTFREFHETKLEVLLIDEDHGSFSAGLERAFGNSSNFRLIKQLGSETLTAESAHRLVHSGQYKTAVIIPKNASAAIDAKTRFAVNRLLAHYGLSDTHSGRKAPPSVELNILFDPAIKANYKQTLVNTVEKNITKMQSDRLMDEVQKYLSKTTKKPRIKLDLSEVVVVRQKAAVDDDNRGIALNAVQHNVPGWSMFAMFFILFPLAGNLIKEREDGSMLRLRLIAGSPFPVIAGKFSFYFLVCLLQLILMICVGLYGMPLFGLSRLVIGTNYLGLFLTGFSVAMAATGYGLLIAVFFKTPHQALSFGSISVVILAAIGGVWVPEFIMPEVMQSISPYSPLNWGLSAFNDLFLRNAATSAIVPDVAKLLCFSCVTLTASIVIYK